MHFYDRAGRPVYEIPRADGTGYRPATLADARKLGLVPGITGVIKQLAAPALEGWKQRQVALAAARLAPFDGADIDGYVARLLAESTERASQAAQRGTEIHAAIEAVFRGEDPIAHRDLADKVHATVCQRFGKCEGWIAEASFAHPLGYGGRMDLHHPEGSGVLIDFKTKEWLQPG